MLFVAYAIHPNIYLVYFIEKDFTFVGVGYIVLYCNIQAYCLYTLFKVSDISVVMYD